MPEIKNNFLKGKMNQDLDDRLLPEGEYRSAKNIQVIRSEGSNAGVVQNMRGTAKIGNISADTDFVGTPEVIGSYFDDKSDTIYYFVTDDTVSKIFKSVSGNTPTAIVSDKNIGFLNLKKSNKITGVNLVEDLLFWTDNLNQPRRININDADGSYYNSEDKVSVARFAPYKAPVITDMTNDPTIESDRIKEEFVRFAYRYKFKNNEYSIISPFTPIAFKLSSNSLDSFALKDAYTTTELKEMVNGVNKITMEIPFDSVSTPSGSHEIERVDILYKESDSSAIRIIDSIDVVDYGVGGATVLLDSSGDGNYYYIPYVYKSTIFKSTLPEDQLIRVFDNIPTKAQAQEVVGNRIVYGNFTQGTSTANVDASFTVTYGQKYSTHVDEFGRTVDNFSNQSIKQRRTYIVGIVLVDKYGRTSPVITNETSTIYIPAKDSSFVNSSWIGDSLKIVFTDNIPNAYNATTNPLGWYSYRVVIKQPQQEYYNVYNPGSYWYDISNTYSFISLHGDNINKVPRDTTSTSTLEGGLLPAGTRLYPKVINTSTGYELSNESIINISSIGDANDFGYYDANNLTPVNRIYEYKSFPLLAKMDSVFGESYYTDYENTFACFETEPFESSLDIYYETATTGLVSEVNDAGNQITIVDFSIDQSDNTVITANFSESSISGTILETLYPFKSIVPLEELIGVDFQKTSGDSKFELYTDPNDGYTKIRTNGYFVYDSVTPSNNIFALGISGTFYGSTINETITLTLQNVNPTISVPVDKVLENTATSISNEDFDGTNGSADPVNNKTGLTFTLVSQLKNGSTAVNVFSITDNTNGTGVVNIVNSPLSQGCIAGDTIELTLQVSDGTNTASDTTVYTLIGGVTSESVWYASSSSFSSLSEACSTPTSNPAWTLSTIYYDSSTDPFTTATPGNIYKNSGLSAFAPSGYYKKASLDTVGFWTSSPTIGAWGPGPSSCTQ